MTGSPDPPSLLQDRLDDPRPDPAGGPGGPVPSGLLGRLGIPGPFEAARLSRAVHRFGVALLAPSVVALAVVPVLTFMLGGGGSLLNSLVPLPIAGGVLTGAVVVLALLVARRIGGHRPVGRLPRALRLTGWAAAGVVGLSNALIPVATVFGEGTRGAGVANALFVLLMLSWMAVLVLAESIVLISPRERAHPRELPAPRASSALPAPGPPARGV